MKKCPYCAEEIREEAIKCKHCGEWLNGNKQETIMEIATKIQDTSGNSLQSLNLKHKDDLIVARHKKSGGYVGGIILFIFYATAMLRTQNNNGDTQLLYFVGKILELIGIFLLFMVYLALRNRMLKRELFLNKKWVASLIAGLVSLFLVSNVIVFVKIMLSRIK